MVNNFIISTLAKRTGKCDFSSFEKAINPTGTGLFLTQGRQCGHVF